MCGDVATSKAVNCCRLVMALLLGEGVEVAVAAAAAGEEEEDDEEEEEEEEDEEAGLSRWDDLDRDFLPRLVN